MVRIEMPRIERTVLDPITREIVLNSLASAADEMALALYRTAYSTIVRDCLDYSTSLCDESGRMIAQGVTVPLHLGSVPTALNALFRRFKDDIEPHDLFIMNDPFDGGMHIPDIFIVKPVFFNGMRVGFSVATAHHADMGGRLPGSSACDNTEIFQDGFRMPWLKLYRRGIPDEAIFTLLQANVRVPRVTLGDLRAQISACNIGEKALQEVIQRYGIETFRACVDDIIDHTERRLRAEIASWPDGSYSFTDYMDSDGIGGPPVRIQVKITVSGDSLTADFTGTSPQVRGAINSTESFVRAGVAFCVRAVMREEVPNSEGLFKPLHIIAPEGSLVNVRMPGASSMRGITGFRMIDAVFGALAQMLPDRVYAAGEGGNTLLILGGSRDEERRSEPFVYYESIAGTWGARPNRDGNDGVCNLASIGSNIPVEQAEVEYPIRIERYGYAADSGGPGQYRGGLAIEREWKLLASGANLTIRSDRRDHLPYGLQGGHSGSGSVNILHHTDGRGAEVLPTLISTSMQQGERIYHRQPSGGGFGNPLLRDPQSVAYDVSNDRVSVESARNHYGVVIHSASGEVDLEATIALRAERMRAPQQTVVSATV
jgi:N-methylhydantoinase B/oxoprolinase/acetone carboxylase alpha subunit